MATNQMRNSPLGSSDPVARAYATAAVRIYEESAIRCCAPFVHPNLFYDACLHSAVMDVWRTLRTIEEQEILEKTFSFIALAARVIYQQLPSDDIITGHKQAVQAS